jgi:primase-polymerase (primpol)-like protein
MITAEKADDDGEAGHDEEADGDVPDQAEYDEAIPGMLKFKSLNFAELLRIFEKCCELCQKKNSCRENFTRCQSAKSYVGKFYEMSRTL